MLYKVLVKQNLCYQVKHSKVLHNIKVYYLGIFNNFTNLFYSFFVTLKLRSTYVKIVPSLLSSFFAVEILQSTSANCQKIYCSFVVFLHSIFSYALSVYSRYAIRFSFIVFRTPKGAWHKLNVASFCIRVHTPFKSLSISWMYSHFLGIQMLHVCKLTI